MTLPGEATALSARRAQASLDPGTGGSSPNGRTRACELWLLPRALCQVELFGMKPRVSLTSVPPSAWLIGRVNEPRGGSFLTCGK